MIVASTTAFGRSAGPFLDLLVCHHELQPGLTALHLAIGIVNGIIRRAAYEDRVGELTAHQIATASYLALFAAYIAWLERRHPLPSRAAALKVGAAWAAGSVVVEFALGRFVTGDSWSTLLEAYNIATGHVWILVPLWIALAPPTLRELRLRKAR